MFLELVACVSYDMMEYIFNKALIHILFLM